jgi:hypothetical protein
MTDAKLETALRSMVRRYGLEQVSICLKEIGFSEETSENIGPNAAPPKDHVPTKPAKPLKVHALKTHAKVAAPEYVAKLGLPPEKQSAMSELAKRFQDKTFLPSFGDIAIFCQNYGIAEPSSKSRANAIPRVFKYLSGMDAGQIQDILKYRMYSGPSELGPIADAIRRNGRAAASRLELE